MNEYSSTVSIIHILLSRFLKENHFETQNIRVLSSASHIDPMKEL